MENLGYKLAKIKNRIAAKGEEDKKTRTTIKDAIVKIFGDEKIITAYVEDFYIKESRLVIKAGNKTFANELFLRKEELLKELSKLKIKELVVR